MTHSEISQCGFETVPRFKSILVTGAAGRLGKVLREALRGRFPVLRLSDVAPLEPAGDGEEIVRCDLRDGPAVETLLDGIDAVVHLAASLDETKWSPIRDVNIDGTYNVYEAARISGTRRIIYASSHHIVGMYKREEHLDLDAPLRPDGLYGVSKAFGEALSRYYWDKFGVESACLRIGSAAPEPRNERALATWLSNEDFVQLVLRCLSVQRLSWTAIYGVSANDRSWWDNGKAGFVGYRPKDNAQHYAQGILSGTPNVAPEHATALFQGGRRAAKGYKADDKD